MSELVTVYIPTFNRKELLQRAIESVLNQSYENLELIVVDDQSTDETVAYLDEVVTLDSRVRYFVNEKNSGACVSRNKAIFSAKGKYITGLDDDDYMLPEHLDCFVRKWKEKKSDVIALYSNVYIKNNTGLNRQKCKREKCEARDLICANWIGNQVFTQTEYLRDIGGFDVDLPAWQDLDCWYRLLKCFEKRAASTSEATYVVDTSHPHERISTGKKKSIEIACDILCKKYILSDCETMILSLQKIPYGFGLANGSSLLFKIRYLPDYYNFRHAISLVFDLLRASRN